MADGSRQAACGPDWAPTVTYASVTRLASFRRRQTRPIPTTACRSRYPEWPERPQMQAAGARGESDLPASAPRPPRPARGRVDRLRTASPTGAGAERHGCNRRPSDGGDSCTGGPGCSSPDRAAARSTNCPSDTPRRAVTREPTADTSDRHRNTPWLDASSGTGCANHRTLPAYSSSPRLADPDEWSPKSAPMPGVPGQRWPVRQGAEELRAMRRACQSSPWMKVALEVTTRGSVRPQVATFMLVKVRIPSHQAH